MPHGKTPLRETALFGVLMEMETTLCMEGASAAERNSFNRMIDHTHVYSFADGWAYVVYQDEDDDLMLEESVPPSAVISLTADIIRVMQKNGYALADLHIGGVGPHTDVPCLFYHEGLTLPFYKKPAQEIDYYIFNLLTWQGYEHVNEPTLEQIEQAAQLRSRFMFEEDILMFLNNGGLSEYPALAAIPKE